MYTHQHDANAGAPSNSRIFGGAPAAAEALRQRQTYDELPTIQRMLREDLGRFDPDADDVTAIAGVGPAPSVAAPFEDAFAPFRCSIRNIMAPASGRIGASAVRDIAGEIIVSIARVCAPTLLAEFDERRSPALALAAKLFGRIDTPERDAYRNFVLELWRGGWLGVLERYPVLERLIALIILRKTQEAAEFRCRLALDYDAICRRFELTGGAIVRVRSGLSDAHHGMRTVKVLEFASGERVVYKPKDLGLQSAWSTMCEWMDMDLPVTRVLERSGYGWMEYVRHDACKNEDAVRRYYYRAGALVCLLYAIRGTDCHFENLLASGEYPVLIDTETLMQPEFEIAGQLLSPAMPDFLARHLANSVVQSGMLPSWEAVGDRESIDAGGLGGYRQEKLAKPGWLYLNTDYMHRGDAVPCDQPRANVPRLAETAVSAKGYVDVVVRGFEDAYRVLVGRREAVLSAAGPLAGFRNRPVRFVLRNTRAYHALLERAISPRNLQSEGDYRAAFDGSLPDLPAWAFAANPDPIWKAETAALMELDIPLFTADANAHMLLAADGTEIDAAMSRSGWDAVTRQIEGLNEADMARQTYLIRLAFQSMSAHEGDRDATPAVGVGESNPRPEIFSGEARRIAEFLLKTAIRGENGEIGWIALNHIPSLDRYTVAPLDHGMWGGSAGIALFLAAVYRSGGGREYRDACLGALARTRRAFASCDVPIETRRALARQHGLGIGAGLGSLVYVMARAGQWLGDRSLINDAGRVATLIDAPLVSEDSNFDVMAGSAGCLLGLLALDEALPESGVRKRAELCVFHLLAHQVSTGSGGAAWPGRVSMPATGFGHGAAGIAYALHCGQRALGSGIADSAIRLALAYESSQFLPEEGNWFDPRSLAGGKLPRCSGSWCSGAPGIGLGRIGMLPADGDAELLEEIETAINFVAASKESQTHHLCCGEMGRIDLLLTASARLAKPGLRQLASRRAAALIAQAHAEGGYRLLSGLPDDSGNPSLFVGLAGIGYEMLRLYDPALFPSILLFQ